MQLKETTRLELPPTADMHVHLRQDEMMELVTPSIRDGGVDTVFVMVRQSLDMFCVLKRVKGFAWLTCRERTVLSPTSSLPSRRRPRRWNINPS